MNKNSHRKKRLLSTLYAIVGIYVVVMYLLCAFRGEQRSYSIMMNLSLAFGLFSGIAFVEADRAKRWIVPVLLGRCGSPELSLKAY